MNPEAHNEEKIHRVRPHGTCRAFSSPLKRVERMDGARRGRGGGTGGETLWRGMSFLSARHPPFSLPPFHPPRLLPRHHTSCSFFCFSLSLNDVLRKVEKQRRERETRIGQGPTEAHMSVSPSVCEAITEQAVAQFQRDGFLIMPQCIFAEKTAVVAFCQRLEAILNGEYDTGTPPYKVGKVPDAWRVNGHFSFEHVAANSPAAQTNRATSMTVHAINVWKADCLFASLVSDAVLAHAVTRLMGWEEYGCRVAQDQIWLKPPHSGPLTYHRDTPYLDFVPKQVCTVWIPFDAVATPDVGTLEYCTASHLWGEERRGSANQFYNADYKALLRTAAEREALRRSACPSLGDEDESSDGAGSLRPDSALLGSIVPVLGDAGCCSFHDGNTWHGSRPNSTAGWRRGIGIHYIRGDAVFAETTGKLWSDLRTSSSCRELPAEHFPPAMWARNRRSE